MLLPRVRWDGSLLLQLDQPSSLSLDLYNYLPSMGNFQILLLLFSKIFNLYCNTPAISYCLGKKKTKSYGREGQISVLRNLSSTLALVMAMLGLLFIGLAWLKVARVGSESDLPWWISFKIDKSCYESSHHSICIRVSQKTHFLNFISAVEPLVQTSSQSPRKKSAL